MRTLSNQFRPALAALTALCGLAVATHADVTEYAVTRVYSYVQTSNAAPLAPELWYLTAAVSGDTPGEMLSASVTLSNPDPISYPLSEATTTFQLFYSLFYINSATFYADYPATTYTISVDRGQGVESGDVFVPEDNFCNETPALTGDTFDRLQNYDTTLPFDGTIGGFTPHPNTNFGRTILSIVQDGDLGFTWVAVLEPGETTFQVPAGLLVPNSGYSMGIEYLNFTYTENAGFGGVAASGAEFVRSTSLVFTTLGDSCDTLITLQPSAGTVDAGDTAAFAVRASPDTDCTISFEWAKDGVPLVDGPTGSGSSLLGASTHTLIISDAQPEDAGDYTCLVSSSCASLLSDAAALTIQTLCPADFDRNGTREVPDIFAFLSAWFAGCP